MVGILACGGSIGIGGMMGYGGAEVGYNYNNNGRIGRKVDYKQKHWCCHSTRTRRNGGPVNTPASVSTTSLPVE